MSAASNCSAAFCARRRIALDVCLTNPRLFSRLGVMIKEVQLHSSVQVVLDWLSAQNAGDIKPYVRKAQLGTPKPSALR